MSISLVHCLLPHFRNSFVPMQFWNARHKMQTSVSWEMMITAGYPFCPSCTAGRIRWPSPSSCVLCRSGTSWCPICAISKHLSLTFTNITLSWRHLLYSCFFHSLMRKAMKHELLPMLVRNSLLSHNLPCHDILYLDSKLLSSAKERVLYLGPFVCLSVCLFVAWQKKYLFFDNSLIASICLSVLSPPAQIVQSIVLKFSEIMVTDPVTVPQLKFHKIRSTIKVYIGQKAISGQIF